MNATFAMLVKVVLTLAVTLTQAKGCSPRIAQSAPGGGATIYSHPAYTNMRFVGHGYGGGGGAGMNEHACRVDRNGVTSYFVQDANNNVAALVSTAGSPIVQYAWTPYGEILAREQFSTHSNNRLGFQGMAADRLSGNVNSTQSLMTGVDGLYQTPNRHYNPTLGRWMQLDPNGTGQDVVDDAGWFGGGERLLAAGGYKATTHFGDGFNLYESLGANPLTRRDPLGLEFTLPEEILIGVMEIAGGFIPDPSDFIGEALEALVEDYGANLEWDVEWALDWDLPDDWHTRGDDTWVGLALGRGLYNAFDVSIPFTDTTINPLRTLSGGRGLPPGGSDGRANVEAKGLQNHHIATNTGPMGRKFKSLFDSVGMSLSDPDNIVKIPHGGRHPREYHQFVLIHLTRAVGNLSEVEAKEALRKELKNLKAFIKKNPHFVYNTAGGRPTGWSGNRERFGPGGGRKK